MDKFWTGPPITIKNSTGTGKTNGTVHLCAGCHVEIRDELDDLVLPNGRYEHPEHVGRDEA